MKLNLNISQKQKEGIFLLIVLIIALWVYYRNKKMNMEYAEPNEPISIPSLTGSDTIPIYPESLSLVPGTKNFKLSEFHCKDGTPVPKEYYGNLQELMNNLQVLREHLGKAIHINSGYRSPAHNKKVGGVKTSQHLVAKAADMHVKGMTPKEIKNSIEFLISTGKMRNGGVGLYPTFVHYDIGSVRRW